MGESGILYSTIIDPVLVKLRKHVASQIKPQQNVIDIACGTGAQAFEIARTAINVTGIDLSESMIKTANKRKIKRNISNINFEVIDATGILHDIFNKFDYAVLSLALHQFPPEKYPAILSGMKSISQNMIIVDYAVPLPHNLNGLACIIAEFLAGKEHHKNFKAYESNNGLRGILKDNKIKVNKEIFIAKGAFQIVIC